MRLIAQEALTNDQIAHRLNIAKGTAKNVVAQILIKRRLPNRTAIASDWANIEEAPGNTAGGKKEKP